MARYSKHKCTPHVVPRNGDDEETNIARLVAGDLVWFGSGGLVVNAGKEPALAALIQGNVCETRFKRNVITITIEATAPYECQRNGAT